MYTMIVGAWVTYRHPPTQDLLYHVSNEMHKEIIPVFPTFIAHATISLLADERAPSRDAPPILFPIFSGKMS